MKPEAVCGQHLVRRLACSPPDLAAFSLQVAEFAPQTQFCGAALL